MPSSYPITHLVVGERYTIACAGPWLQLLDTSSGVLLAEEDTVLPIRVLAVDETFEHIVTTADSKKLIVRRREGLEVLSTRELPKRATSMTFADPTTLVVADKFGDVFRYPLQPAAPSSAAQPEASTSTPYSTSTEGHLLLGHVSIVTSLVLSPLSSSTTSPPPALGSRQRYVITADRDEHIRVSRYPSGYVISHFLWGHTKYVSALLIPHFSPDVLISGGGEGELFVWEWREGRLTGKVGFGEVARGSVRVKPKRRVLGRKFVPGEKRLPGQKGERDGSKSGTPAAEGEEAKGGEEEGDVEMTAPAEEGRPAPDEPTQPGTEERDDEPGGEQKKHTLVPVESPDETDITFVVQQISALEVEGERVVVFSLVGSSALLYFSLPTSASASLTETDVKALDLGRPVLDFSTQGGSVWASLDAAWPPGSGDSGPSVRVAQWKNGALVLLPAEGSNTPSPLLEGLVTHPHPATPAQLAALESYENLLLLPKWAEDPAEAGEGEHPGWTERSGAKSEGRKKTRERLARLALGGTAGGGAGEGEEGTSKRQKT